MILDYTTLKAGDRVAVAKPSSWSIINQGVYVVEKVNKVKVVVRRLGDHYERTFSVKKRRELGDYAGDTYTAAYLETVAEQEARLEQRKREVALREAWGRVELAASRKNLAELKAMMAELEQMVV
jgi:bifunctional DNA-binding transcriptional regulator/antitoxin component of YhaV-PrlF toxin-antitoxin module